jgi:hypothetical protein
MSLNDPQQTRPLSLMSPHAICLPVKSWTAAAPPQSRPLCVFQPSGRCQSISRVRSSMVIKRIGLAFYLLVSGLVDVGAQAQNSIFLDRFIRTNGRLASRRDRSLHETIVTLIVRSGLMDVNLAKKHLRTASRRVCRCIRAQRPAKEKKSNAKRSCRP